jgi:hypothetical protein
MPRLFYSAVLLMCLCVPPALIHAQAPTKPAADQPFTIQYYYKVHWGHADEFLQLFKKNHYPLLKKEVESGRILKVWMDQPQLHMTEDSRWDYRVTIVFKNVTVANTSNPNEQAEITSLYPDQQTYKGEEQRRFEILDAHWDVPIQPIDLDSR